MSATTTISESETTSNISQTSDDLSSTTNPNGVYSVSFYVDGELWQTDIVVGNAKVQKPEDPKKNGYNFLGWTVGEYSSNFYNFRIIIFSINKQFNYTVF